MSSYQLALVLLAAATLTNSYGADLMYATPFDYSDFFGFPSAFSIASDPAGNLYVSSFRADLHYIPNLSSTVNRTAWVKKFVPDGKTQISYSGLPYDTVPSALVADLAGNVYLAGTGTTKEFTPEVFQTSSGSGFLAKFGPDGKRLWFARISGIPTAIATDAAGFVYLAGSAQSDFVTTPGALKEQIGAINCTGYNGPEACTDAFVMKVKPDGSAIVYATLLGGSWEDRATSMKVDAEGAVWVTGETRSPDFPATAGAFQPKYGGMGMLGNQRLGDAFAARIGPDGKSLRWATYLGGTGAEFGPAIALDNSGQGFIIGTTLSSDFPVSSGASQQRYGGWDPDDPIGGDVFLTKISQSGSVAFSSYMGSAGSESALSIAIAEDDLVFMTVRGPVAAGFEERPLGGCEAPSSIVQVDAKTGRVVDYQTLHGVFGPDLTLDSAGQPVTLGMWDTFNPFAPADLRGKNAPLVLAAFDFTRPAKPRLTCLVNAGSMKQGRVYGAGLAVAPGEIVTIMGSGLGPESGMVAALYPGTSLPTELGGTVVKFGGVPAGLMYVQDRQINLMVPYSMQRGSAPVTVERAGRVLGPYNLNVIHAVPGFFTTGQRGTGQMIAYNEDGTLNSESNPAPRETITTLLVTGFGELDPVLGRVAGEFYLNIATGPSSFTGMGLVSAEPVSRQVSGLIAVKAWIPPTAITGKALVKFTFAQAYGSEPTQANVFLAVN